MFQLKRASDVSCEQCGRLVARQLSSQIQIKAGKVFVHTAGPASVQCWNCGHDNLISVEAIETPVTMVPADSFA